jgi:hypothetical protein
VHDLVGVRDVRVASALRRMLAADPSRAVRGEAAAALALLGDGEILAPLVRDLLDRAEEPEQAGLAARALGVLGDARAADALADALVDGFKSRALRDAAIALGVASASALLDRVIARPELAEQKKAIRDVFEGLAADGAHGAERVQAILLARAATLGADELARAARALVSLASAASPGIGAACASALASRASELGAPVPELSRAQRRLAARSAGT